MKIEEEKKELINREIAKFRDVYHKVDICSRTVCYLYILPMFQRC